MKKPQSRRQGPRVLTMTMSNKHQPYLMLAGKRYSLRNFSQSGLGVFITPPFPFKEGAKKAIKGQLFIEKEKFEVSLKVAHLSERHAGLEITKVPVRLKDALNELLQSAFFGHELEAHPKNLSLDDINGYPRLWYYTENRAELIVWYHPTQFTVQSLQLCWLGKWVYRKAFGNPLTGYLRDSWGIGQGHMKDSADILFRTPKVDDRLIQEASQVLSALVPPLPGAKLWQFLTLGEQVVLPVESFPKKKAA